ncbi:MAG: hypothetical protein BJ554DRAFT_2416, partial [Olpidium bornovanus]
AALLDRIHSDLPEFPVTFFGGSRWIVTFLDENTRYIMVYFRKTKYDAFSCFEAFVAAVEVEHGRRPKALQVDSGRECINEIWKHYVTNHLRIFGCLAFINVPKQCKQHKLAPRGERVVFVGYEVESKVLKILESVDKGVRLDSVAQPADDDAYALTATTTCADNDDDDDHFQDFDVGGHALDAGGEVSTTPCCSDQERRHPKEWGIRFRESGAFLFEQHA